MTAEDTIAVLREWGTLIAAIVAGVVTIINALRAKEAVVQVKEQLTAQDAALDTAVKGVDDVKDRLGLQDEVLAETASNLGEYHDKVAMETVQLRSDQINLNLENHRKIDALTAKVESMHNLVAELATRPKEKS